MESETEVEQGRLYKTVTKGLQVIRNGLRNIASAPERQLLTKYRAPVSAKYNVSCSRVPKQSESGVTISLGHGFQHLRMDLMPQVKCNLIRPEAEKSSHLHPGHELQEHDPVLTKLGLATIKDSGIILRNLRQKIEPCSAPQYTSAKVLAKIENTREPSCTTRYEKKLSIHSSNDIVSAPETKCISTSTTEAMGMAIATESGKDLFIHSESMLSNITTTPTDELTGIQYDSTSFKVSTTDTESPLTKSASANRQEDCHIVAAPADMFSVKSESGSTLAKHVEDIRNNEESVEISPNSSEITVSKSDATPGSNDLPKFRELNSFAISVPKEILSSKQDGNSNLSDIISAVPSDVPKCTLPQNISAQDVRGSHNGLENIVPSEKLSPNVKAYVNEVHPKSCSESVFQNTESLATSTNIKRRPRPRRLILNTDRKMWMSKKSSGVQEELDTGSICQITQKHDLGENPSAEDMMSKMFGFDPFNDVFLSTRTNKALPKSLTDVKVEIFRRQEVQFYKNDEDEFNITSESVSCVLYLASKNGKDILVKDSSKCSRSAFDVLKEARILSVLNDMRIVPCFYGVLEQGLLEREYSVVFEKCDGFLTLTQLLKSGYYLSRKDWMNISLSLAAHLKILHSHRVLHNNICPDNILVNKDSLEVKLVGFSQASYGEGVKLPRAARHHQGVSPEVKYGCITSPYSDVYALGSVLEQVMVESRVMDLHEVVLLNHQDLPRDRPQAEKVFSMIRNIYNKFC